jgi:acetyl esterase/lipase
MLRNLPRAGALAVLLLSAVPAFGSERNVSYGPDPAQKLDICTPPAGGGAAPALLLIHGGGWTHGSRANQAHQCEYYAQAGIVAIPVDYRLAAAAPDTKWPAQFEDVQLAMRWVRAHARDYGIDPSRVCAEGVSAGGQLALLLGVVPGIDPGDMQALLPNVSPHADCVISISGPSDLKAYAAVRPGDAGMLFGKGDPAGTAARQLSASPALRVTKAAVPALIIHGLTDRLVPFEQATEMQDALTRAGIPSWLVSYGGGHGLHVASEELHEVWALVGEFVRTHHLPGPPRQLALEEALRVAK